VASARNGSKVESVRAQLIRLVAAAAEGERMPAERELCAAWGVARMTLRRALDELVAEGLLVRRQGQGTFVARPRMARHLSIKSFTEQMRRQGPSSPGCRTSPGSSTRRHPSTARDRSRASATSRCRS
jgi:GntR family transcriptional regulator